jgi:hypothetical protein
MSRVTGTLCTPYFLTYDSRLTHFSFGWVCIRSFGNMFAEPLSSNGRLLLHYSGFQASRNIARSSRLRSIWQALILILLVGGIYEIRRWDGFSFRNIRTSFHKYWFGDSVVGITTGYGLDDWGVGVRVPVGSRIFSSPRLPDRLWGPPNLLSNGYRDSFPGGKAARAWNWPLTSS